MKRWPSGSPCGVLVGIALSLHVPMALAQPAPVVSQKPLEQSLHGGARDAYSAATRRFANGDFRAALAEYRRAYEQSNDPRLLYDMALCERNVGAYVRTRDLLQRYKRESGATLSPDERAGIDAALSSIHNLVGLVKLSVNEADAAVTVDGETVGTTPLAEPLFVDLGKHAVTATKPGFTTAEQSVDVAGGAEVSVALELVAREPFAHLVVAAEDAATVVIDGQTAARGRFDGRLAAGNHHVSVTEPGKTPFEARLGLREGETRTIDVTLQDERRSGAIWPWIVGGAAVAAGAAVGGYFLFKSSPEPAGFGGQYATVRFN
jgi:hypothetical protein